MKILSKILFIAILAVMFACDKNDDSKENPVFSVKLTDAPAGYDAVNVEILSMEANMGSGWVEYPVLEPGVMTELRLILGTNNSVVIDNISYELQTPSGQTSGYKIKMDQQPLELGGLYRLVLDFDVSESVHPTGNGKYMLKPVIRGYLETAIGSIAGAITHQLALIMLKR